MSKFFLAMILSLSINANALLVGIGATSGTTSVGSNSSDKYTYNFVGGYLASVGISGDGDTDLDLYIYDQNGNEICSSTTYGDTEACSWNPRWTGPFRIVVKNRGNVYNKYFIVIQ